MNRRQILRAARRIEGNAHDQSAEGLQADLIYLTKLMVDAQQLMWHRPVVRELAHVESYVIGRLRDDHQDRPMPRRRQRRTFVRQQATLRALIRSRGKA